MREIREVLWTEGSEDHIARHGVTPEEVEDVLYTRPRWRTVGREGTTLVYGTTIGGRLLLAVLADGCDGRWFVVTARDMDTAERRAFRRKAR